MNRKGGDRYLLIPEPPNYMGEGSPPRSEGAGSHDYETTMNELIEHEKSTPGNISMSTDKKFHARISSYELTVLELLTDGERSAYLDNIAEAVKAMTVYSWNTSQKKIRRDRHLSLT